MDFPHLFEPIDIGTVKLKNRVVIPAHGPRLPPARYLRYLEERVKSGVSLFVCSDPALAGVSSYTVGPPSPVPSSYLGGADVMLPNPARPGGAEFFDNLLIPRMKEQAELAHRYEAFCFGQLVHAGGYITAAHYQPGLSPSAEPDELLGDTPHELDEDEIADLVRIYGDSAARVQKAGMDGVEVHACHGLLLNSFLSPLSNKRTDRYGGALENRARFILEALNEVRRRVGPDFPIGLRMPGNELLEGGLTTEDVVNIARLVEPHLEYLNISAASESGRKGGLTVPTVMPADFPQAVFADSAAAIKAAVRVPVLLTGGIRDPEVAEQALADGKADLVGMVRAFIADPDWAKKARDGEVADLRRCTGDNEGCRKRTLFRSSGGGMPIGCTTNAAAGREEEMEIVPATVKKRVLVVGGGPGGMEAARVAALRGHVVVLCERDGELGGQVRVAIRDPRTARLGESIRYLVRQMELLPVDVRLNTEVDVATVTEIAPDAIIIATGATAKTPSVPGIDGPNVTTIREVLGGEATVGQRVCVVAEFDGHHGPASLAELLADQGRDVDLITERMVIAEAQDPGQQHALLKRLMEKNVGLHTLTGLKSVHEGSVTVFNSLTRGERTLEKIDTVVLAVGGRSENALLRELKATVGELYGVGDCLTPRRVLHAVLDGSRAGRAV
jgi:2,4-dienoyl-CoA reductase-like NADH-dependent reductase (Old Yellow Enzyme family)/thioredoxin reductase